jgi:hypothetical protein
MAIAHLYCYSMSVTSACPVIICSARFRLRRRPASATSVPRPVAGEADGGALRRLSTTPWLLEVAAGLGGRSGARACVTAASGESAGTAGWRVSHGSHESNARWDSLAVKYER